MDDMKYFVKTFTPYKMAFSSGPKGSSFTYTFKTIEEVKAFISDLNLKAKLYAQNRKSDWTLDDLPTQVTSIFYGKEIKIEAQAKDIEQKIITHGYVEYQIGDGPVTDEDRIAKLRAELGKLNKG